MKQLNLTFENNGLISENEYSLETESNIATLFTTGNGYIGVRGSLEEYGSLRIQGCYIRGLIDRIYELPQPFADNLYMKKYYFDEDKLKHFEKQDSIINFADILLIRVKIRDETFYPWEGKLISWKRTLDLKNACLIREVCWEDTKGNVSIIKFERFSSFDNDHIYCIRVSVMPVNHHENIEITSGIDLRTKTNGQRVTKSLSTEVSGNKLFYSNLSGDTYKFTFFTGVSNSFYSESDLKPIYGCIDDGDLLANTVSFSSEEGKTYTLEKKIYIITSRDTDENLEKTVKSNIANLDNLRYKDLFERHTAEWNSFFSNIDINIKGDENADMSLRFSNYHTAITFARNDAVHSISAKGLSGEAYNNFIWWDCEVYQAPVFFETVPQAAKNIIIYRYDKLNAARENAKKEGRSGARYPFTSSVTGDETVWEYARHPFMQVHIVSDVAWSVINYYICTGDTQFMLDYGLEILWETSKYWASRVEYNLALDRYEIKTVTGTDEHHPYVDNDAYTNYEVCFIMKYSIKFYEDLKEQSYRVFHKIDLLNEEVDLWKIISNKMYLPLEKETGMIPQFDGYFQLNRDLEVKGGSTAKSCQMKQSGLYHQCQVIKQPDVMLLFSYLNFTFDNEIYKKNWNYYEARCESSSSLSYSVHSICASDMDQPESAYKYFLKTARLDMDDEHDCAWQGMHSACAAGAWLSVTRGIAGVVFRENKIEVNPHMIPWWEEVSFSLVWHNQRLKIKLNINQITIYSDKSNSSAVQMEFKGKTWELKAGGSLIFDIPAVSNAMNAFRSYKI